jgi:hypothetical protein
LPAVSSKAPAGYYYRYFCPLREGSGVNGNSLFVNLDGVGRHVYRLGSAVDSNGNVSGSGFYLFAKGDLKFCVLGYLGCVIAGERLTRLGAVSSPVRRF